jgi:hypothetical protein
MAAASPRLRSGRALAALGLALLLALAPGCLGSDDDDAQDGTITDLPAEPVVPEPGLGPHGSVAERVLALQFRPRLRFDSAERWRPLAVRPFLAERFAGGRGHGACRSGERPPCPVLERPELDPEIALVDIYGRIDNGADAYGPANQECIVRAPLDCDAGPGSAIYYRRTSHAGRWYWDYWWFLRYNDYNGARNRCRIYCADHEGDWEGVTVVTTAAEKPELVAAIFAAHSDRVLVPLEALLRTGTHIQVFIADGTHAAYAFPCEVDCRQYVGKPFLGALPEEHHDGEAPWGENRDPVCLEQRCLRPLPEEPTDPPALFPAPTEWNGWPGRWGASCADGCIAASASPRSPGSQDRYLCPWVPTRRHSASVPRLAPLSGQPDSERIRDADEQVDACRKAARESRL